MNWKNTNSTRQIVVQVGFQNLFYTDFFALLHSSKTLTRSILVIIIFCHQVYNFSLKRFEIYSGVQTTIPTKNQGTQCLLLKDMFVTSTPCQSEDEGSESEEEEGDMDDDPSYDPEMDDDKIENDDDDDYDDCLYE